MTALHTLSFIHNLLDISSTDIENSFPGVGDDNAEPDRQGQIRHQS